VLYSFFVVHLLFDQNVLKKVCWFIPRCLFSLCPFFTYHDRRQHTPVPATITLQIGELRTLPNGRLNDRTPFVATLRRQGQDHDIAHTSIAWSVRDIRSGGDDDGDNTGGGDGGKDLMDLIHIAPTEEMKKNKTGASSNVNNFLAGAGGMGGATLSASAAAAKRNKNSRKYKVQFDEKISFPVTLYEKPIRRSKKEKKMAKRRQYRGEANHLFRQDELTPAGRLMSKPKKYSDKTYILRVRHTYVFFTFINYCAV
jgi:hypothetical protein